MCAYNRRSAVKNKEMERKYAIFDLDGTILYTLEDLQGSLNYALARAGLPLRTADEVRRFVGNGIRKLIERAAPDVTDRAELDAIYKDLKYYYETHPWDTTRVYPGISELMHTLKACGWRIGVASNKDDSLVRLLMAHFFPGLVDFAMGFRDGMRRKPDPGSALAVLEVLCGIAGPEDVFPLELSPGQQAELQKAKAAATYIGDSEVDGQTAENLGVESVIVSWGFRTEEELAACGAGPAVSNCSQLLRRIMKIK